MMIMTSVLSSRLSVVRLLEEGRRRAGAFDARQELQERVEQVQVENMALKIEYDALLERQRGAETRLREEKVRGGHLLADMIHPKQQAAARMNSRNERRSRYLNTPHTPVHHMVTEEVQVPERTTAVFVFSSELEKRTCRRSFRRLRGQRSQWTGKIHLNLPRVSNL